MCLRNANNYAILLGVMLTRIADCLVKLNEGLVMVFKLLGLMVCSTALLWGLFDFLKLLDNPYVAGGILGVVAALPIWFILAVFASRYRTPPQP